MSKTPTLLIDGDIYLYRAASAAEEETDWGDDIWSLSTDLKEAKYLFDLNVQRFLEKFDTERAIICLSDTVNFRKSVEPSYKGHRKKSRKPVGYVALVAWCKDNYNTFHKDGLEADDCLGIMATKPDTVGSSIVISDDKDLMTIPCKLYRPMQDERLDISLADADRYFFTQCLTGDTADGYPGCPGIGPKKAEAILGTQPAWSSVVSAYEKQGLTADDALRQARLARILRWSDWDQDNNTYILWEPGR